MKDEERLQRFKDKASEVHSNKYDYSRVAACGSKALVEIICPDHGSFFQRKDVHLRGVGCKQCKSAVKGNTLKRTMEELLEEFRKRHGDSYDYSNVHTTRTTEKISIICKKHGVFKQTVAHHLVSKGCPECSYDKARMTQQEFIDRSRIVHNGKYDYSRVELTKGSKQKVNIVCPTHGEFTQAAGEHALGKGCKKCGDSRGVAARTVEYTTEAFISKAKEVHGDKYDYSLTEYVNTDTKVKIICSEHGVFEQLPGTHLRPNGCILCRNDSTTYNFVQKYRDDKELGEREGTIYVLRISSEKESFLKLGITSDMRGRLRRYRQQFKETGYSFETLYKKSLPNYQTAMLENDILKTLRVEEKMYKPLERFSGHSECAVEDSLDYIITRIDSHTPENYYY